MRLKQLFILLLGLSTTAATITYFAHTDIDIIGRVRCTMRNQWCVHLLLIESDTFENDVIAQWGVQCTHDGHVNYAIKGSDAGDGIFDDTYELVLSVQHTCSDFGMRKTFKHDLGSFDAYQGLIQFNASEVLLDDKGFAYRFDSWGEHL